MLKRMVFFTYGVIGHLLFLATYAWLAGFVGNLVVPRSVDSPSTASVPLAVAIDLGLIVLFGLQHSIMARPGFKAVWTRVVPQSIERSTYVYVACALTMLLMWQWQSIDVVVWNVQNPAGRWLLHGLFACGWLMVPAVSMMISHCDLFGTRQVWLYLRGREYTALPFRTPLLYRQMRHPMYVGWAIAFWATPTMTAGHLLLAAGMSVYMLVAIVFEERDLSDFFGSRYAAYQRRVPMFLPWFGSARPAPSFDWNVLTDPAWMHWVLTVPLLAAHLAGIEWALAAAMVLCALMCIYLMVQLRGVKPLRVQVRLAYFGLLAISKLPGFEWVNWMLLAGMTVTITTGYCPLGRVLSLLPFNQTERLSLALVRRLLLSPAAGGLLRWPASGPTMSADCGRAHAEPMRPLPIRISSVTGIASGTPRR